MIKKTFKIITRKPKEPNITHKDPFSFQFDDLRLYVTLKPPPYLPNNPIHSVIFEIQVKTFLQHAWSLATHDLIYKTSEINWAKERIAFQIKAMLEQVEVALSGVSNLMKVPEVSKETHKTIRQKEILSFYLNSFNHKDLPNDVLRLCENTEELMKAIGLKLPDIVRIFKEETVAGRGKHIRNLSPFLIVLQSIINQQESIVESYINDVSGKKSKILMPKEIHTSKIQITTDKNLVRI